MTTMHDDELPIVDDELAPPLWFKYAVNTDYGHDKFWEVTIDLADDGRYMLTRRWGRRPDYLNNGQTKTQPYVNQRQAIDSAIGLYEGKLRGGYREVPRGW